MKYEIGDGGHVRRDENVSMAERGWSMYGKVIGKQQFQKKVGAVLGQDEEMSFDKFGSHFVSTHTRFVRPVLKPIAENIRFATEIWDWGLGF